MRRALALSLGLTLAACGQRERCASPDEVLVGAVTCADAAPAVELAQALAARALTPGQQRALFEGLASAGEADPAALAAGLQRHAAWRAAWGASPPAEAALERSRTLYAMKRGAAPWSGGVDGAVAEVTLSAAALWSTSDAHGLALSEMDIEGWIRLASLCREVQGGTPLRVSVADRVPVYAAIRERFEGADSATAAAMVSVGPFWASLKGRWQGASAERQQAWIAAAPLPPAQTADSQGYLRSVLALPLDRLVASVHEHFGPLAPIGAP